MLYKLKINVFLSSKRLYVLIALLFSPATFASCVDELEKDILSKYQRQKGLSLVPGKEFSYSPKSEFYKFGAVRLQDAYLTVSRRDNISGIAMTLAMNDPPEAQRIQQIIERRLMNEPDEPIPISLLMPSAAKELHNKRAPCIGPNCHNATLHFLGVENALNVTTESTLKTFVETSCDRLPEGSELKYGDIMIYRAKLTSDMLSAGFKAEDGDDIFHSAIYVDDNIVRHKGSKLQEDGYYLETLANTFKSYDDLEFTIDFYRRRR